MTFTLRAYVAGDPSVCRVVEISTSEEEDAKRLSRERTRLASERTRHVNRIRALLSLHGIRSIKGLWSGDWRAQLDQLVTGDGRMLGPYLKAEIIREFARLHLVMDQIRELEGARREALIDHRSPFPDKEKVATPTKLASIGVQNRRHLASYLGLAPSPYASGEMQWDQGISKAGSKPARTLLVEIT